MSRLIVKNLPQKVNPEKLKEHFATQGVITDVQLKYTSNGKFRHFGFIGFKTAEEAEKAKNYFNNTYINQSKISVEFCTELGDANKPKAWSKYAPDSSAYKKLHAKQDIKEVQNENCPPIKDKKKNKKGIDVVDPIITEKLKQHKDDPLFLEFLEAHSKKGTDDSWRKIVEDQDSGVVEEENEKDNSSNQDKEEDETDKQQSSAFSSISDLEYLKLKKKSSNTEPTSAIKEDTPVVKHSEEPTEKFHVVKVSNLAFSTKKRELKEFFRPLTPASIRIPRKISGFAYISFKTTKEVKKALNKNKSFLNGKQVIVKEYNTPESKDDSQINEIKNEKHLRWKEQEELLTKEESIAESGSIFVRNLPYTVNEEELTNLFTTFGPLADVTMPVDRITRRVKGFATLTFMMPEHAVTAYSKLDGTVFHGRMLHLLPGKSKPVVDEEDDSKTFKEKKKDKQKATAGLSHNWNSLFLGQNAVADLMAKTYSLSKREVLTASDGAVKLALCETQIALDTRNFLLDSGVSLDAFNQAPKVRSKTVILVKNLPANTLASELMEKFGKFGELGRVVLPPSGVTAIVEFLEPSEAKKAFLSLAYTPFKHLPLYLEWAPEDTFSTSKEKEDNVESSGKSFNANENEESQNKSEDDELEPEPDTTLYVKNLNFNTTEDSVKQHFSACGRVSSVTVARKKDPARPGQLLSMGYGFVQYYTLAHLNQALKTLQHSTLDGYKLELKRSNRTLQDNGSKTKKKNNVEKQSGTKILVRNIPFQATYKEIYTLFKAFGEIKSLRMPKKMVGSGSHRGFAFVDFITKEYAKRAMQALCQSTHLFGRRLVLEWAQADEDVEQLRKRTAEHFKPESASTSKKSRADLQIEDEEDDD